LKKITGEKPYTGNYKGRFRKAMEQLVDFRLIPDIHAGNVMRDRHDTPIVIDPILVRLAYQQSVYG
ncbi:MAG: hypothetical protein J0H31_29770, partial [Alphaproteobacteria bacterium]|nr:hypothetical protein [Alphaproteobacteria bacterium]